DQPNHRCGDEGNDPQDRVALRPANEEVGRRKDQDQSSGGDSEPIEHTAGPGPSVARLPPSIFIINPGHRHLRYDGRAEPMARRTSCPASTTRAEPKRALARRTHAVLNLN